MKPLTSTLLLFALLLCAACGLLSSCDGTKVVSCSSITNDCIMTLTDSTDQHLVFSQWVKINNSYYEASCIYTFNKPHPTFQLIKGKDTLAFERDALFICDTFADRNQDGYVDWSFRSRMSRGEMEMVYYFIPEEKRLDPSPDTIFDGPWEQDYFWSFDTNFIFAAVERNLATMEEMPPDNIEDDTLPENLAQQLRLFFSCASIEEINRFINPEIGLTILYANGCYPEYSQLDSLDPNKNAYQYTLPFWISESLFQSIDFKNLKINHFQYTYTPVFQRETIFKEGVFIDQSEDKTVMSNAIKNLIQTRGKEGADASYLKKLKKDLAFYKKMEKNSLRIVITDKKSPTVGGKTRIFHFHEKNGRLYLFLIDFYSIDGSV